MPSLVPIRDPDDPRIAAYRLVRERDLVGRRGEFIAEGEVVLRVLLGPASRCRASSLLIAERRVAGLESLLRELPADVPVYVADQPAMDAIAGFPIHRGVLAHGRRPADAEPEALLRSFAAPRAVVLALFGISNHDNIGGIFRNAAAFGADAVLLDPGCCDPLYRKAIRVSVGATLKVPFARLSADDPLETLTRAGFVPLALTPSGAEPLAGLAGPPRTAVLLGAEGEGLAPDLLARARTVAIAMAPGWDSLNVATATGIVLHELTRRA